jgi:hypothetical protein
LECLPFSAQSRWESIFSADFTTSLAPPPNLTLLPGRWFTSVPLRLTATLLTVHQYRSRIQRRIIRQYKAWLEKLARASKEEASKAKRKSD